MKRKFQHKPNHPPAVTQDQKDRFAAEPGRGHLRSFASATYTSGAALGATNTERGLRLCATATSLSITTLLIAIAVISLFSVTAVPAKAQATDSVSTWVCPVKPATGDRWDILSAFGLYRFNGKLDEDDRIIETYNGGGWHKGIDISIYRRGEVIPGTPIVAVESGVMERNESITGAGGWWTRLRADSGNFYYFAHMLQKAIHKDDSWVEAGTIIGYVGKTGNAANTPEHLHFTFGLGAETNYINPIRYINMYC